MRGKAAILVTLQAVQHYTTEAIKRSNNSADMLVWCCDDGWTVCSVFSAAGKGNFSWELAARACWCHNRD